MVVLWYTGTGTAKPPTKTNTYFLQKVLDGQVFKSRQYETNIVANLPETFPGPAV